MKDAHLTTQADPVRTRTSSVDPARAPKRDNSLQDLQHAVGNRALNRLLAHSRPPVQDAPQQIQRKCSECEEEEKEEG
ncbi:MAG TPA: hypothetical protein VFH01_13610 [Pyrinomonadaceae bacterium]|nr:hypothetical protein [Pyrinomonadaceae bacterium]